MPRHPPNAHKNKQHNTRQNTCRRLTVRCSRPLYSSQPTHPHPAPTTHTRQQNTGQATRAHCPRTPTACHPQQEGAPTTADHHDHNSPSSPPQRACLLCQHQATNPTPAPTTQARHQSTSQPPSFPRAAAPGRPGPNYTAQTRSNDQEATPTQPILRKEVIQPHLPVRLPCYDFVPITSPTFDRSP